MSPVVLTSLLFGTDGWAGVEVVAPPGWHVYWENPGDSGLATTVTVKGPEGWNVGAVRMPGPHRFLQPGGIVNFGWERVVFPFSLAGAGRGVVHAEVSFLVCNQDHCVPGGASVHRRVPRKPRNDLAEWLDRLPIAVEPARITSAPGRVEVSLADVLDVFPDAQAIGVNIERSLSGFVVTWPGALEPGASVVAALAAERYVEVHLDP